MAQERAALRTPAAVERRPPTAATAVRSPAASVLSSASALRQRLGNQGTQALLAGAALQASMTMTMRGAVTGEARAGVPGGGEPAGGELEPRPKETRPAAAPEAAGASAPAGAAAAAPEETAAAPAAGGARAPAAAPAAPAKEAPETKPEAAEAKPAPPPSPREAIAPAISAVRRRATGERAHSKPSNTPVASAQAAAVVPRVEQTRSAATQTVANLDAADPEAVKREQFKAKLKKAIEDATTPKPTTESQADRMMKQGAAQASGTLRGELKTERDAAAGPMKSAAQTEVTPDKEPAPKKVDMQPEPLGAPPAPVPAASVAPAPLPPERLDYSSDREPADRAMAENNVTQEQMQKGNDPAFGPTLEARSTAEQHEAQAQARYRQSEAQVQDQARASAHSALAKDLAGMHGARGLRIGSVIGQQIGTQAKDAAERQRITDTITGIKNRTRSAVEAILGFMEVQAGILFEAGLGRAESAYENTFEEAKGGIGTWLTTWGSDWEELIESSLAKARVEYLRQVDVAIDQVADFVDAQLKLAKSRVTAGRVEVDTFVKGLDASVQSYGAEALKAVSADFDALETEIDERRDALINKLVQQYKSSYERMSAMEEKLREENKSLWQRVYDATIGLIKKIIAFKDMLVSILSKAASLIVDIISDPIGFLGNLVSGVMQGLKNFMSNIASHLKKGLMEWLFGALAGAGLQLPDTFDLKGILSIVLQILGLTYANFRARAVAILGEPVVAALEQAAEVFKVFVTEGVGGLWRFIKDKVADLKSMVLDAIFDFVKEKVLIAGVTWIIGLLNPASAFFKACKAIYDIIVFFINRGSQIVALVNAIIDSVASIVKGNLSVAATMVENALAKAIPVGIGFLASLLGLGDPAKPVRETIEKAQAPVNKAIDWVINQAVKLVKAAGKLVGGIFGTKDKDKKTAHEDDPERAAKIEAALAAIHLREKAVAEGDSLTLKDAHGVVAGVKRDHPVLKTLTVVPAGDGWTYEYTASERRTEASAFHRQFDREQVFLLVSDIAKVRYARALQAIGTPAKGGESPLAIKPGEAPEQLGARIASRPSAPTRGSTVELGVGSSTVFAKQGAGVENVIIAGLGKYRDITAKLERRGWDGPRIHRDIVTALRTGQGDIDIMRLVALLFGAETARLAMATVTSPLAVGAMGRGAGPGQVFGAGETPGMYPEAAVRARSAAGRAEAIAAGGEFRPGTQVQERGEAYIRRVVDLVYHALEGEKIADTDRLRARILALLERFEKEIGVVP